MAHIRAARRAARWSGRSGDQRAKPLVVGEVAGRQGANGGMRLAVAGEGRETSEQDELVGGERAPSAVEVELREREMDARRERVERERPDGGVEGSRRLAQPAVCRGGVAEQR